MHSLLLIAALIAADGSAKAAITTRHGNPAPLKVPVGGALFLSAKTATHGGKSASVKWVVTNPIVKDKDGNVVFGPRALNQRCESITLLDDDGSKNPCLMIPYGNDFATFNVQQFVALGDTGDWTEVDIRVEGGIPPPVPDDDDKKDDDKKDKPPPVVHEHLTIIVIDDFPNMTANTALIRNSTYWDKLKSAGHAWAWYSSVSREGKAFLDVEAVGVSLPALIVFDQHTKAKLTTQKLPKDVATLDTLLKLYTPKTGN